MVKVTTYHQHRTLATTVGGCAKTVLPGDVADS